VTYSGDLGAADPEVEAVLTAFAAGACGEHEVLTALAGARLLMPVVEMPPESMPHESDGCGRGEMAAPAIVGRDGRKALPAFTSLTALQRWQAAARPVPVPASSVWQSAAQDGQAVIIDIAGPVPLAVDGARLAALASGEQVPRMHEDPDVRAAMAEVAAAQPPGIRIRLGPGAADADLTLELAPAAAPVLGTTALAATGEDIAEQLAARLAGRVRRGITVVVVPAAGE
jgi:hypothetical protein